MSGRSVLVIGDSLTFHGPEGGELLTEPRLWPNICAAELGRPLHVVARQGWTARDAWWALTKDPRVYSLLLPEAAAVLLAVGNMDQLPTALPTYLREGVAYLHPEAARRRARRLLLAAQPRVVRLTGGRLRALSQRRTDEYLTRCVTALRTLRPDLVVLGVVPPGFDSPYYGRVTRSHVPAVHAARSWGRHHGVELLDWDRLAAPYLATGSHNADGLHWGWALHAEVGHDAATRLAALLDAPGARL